MSTTKTSALFQLEQETVGQIPEDQRYGTSKSLVAIWSGMNMTPLTIVTGAVATTLFELPLGWAIVAILVGHLLGGVGMALHAAQGPRLGVPQMLQARGQFGTYGSVFIVLVAAIMFVGYFASNLLVGAQSTSAIIPQLGQNAGIVIGVILSFVIAIFGYAAVRFATAVSTYVVGALVIAAFVVIAASGDISHIIMRGHFSWVGFSAMVAIGIVWQLTYAPYVSDYSRYMPKNTGARGAFWGSYTGCVSSSVILMILGAIVGLAVHTDNTMDGLDTMVGRPLSIFVLIAFALAAWTGNSVNVYCSCLCAITLVQTFVADWRPRLTARVVTTVVLHVISMVLAIASATRFASAFDDFLSLLLYVLIPWSAINLVDYYIVRRGDYVVSDFYLRDGGRYGRWNIPACVVFVVGVLVQLPFLVVSFYTGPVARALHEVDIAWLVGFAVSGFAYWAFARFAPALTRVETPARVKKIPAQPVASL